MKSSLSRTFRLTAAALLSLAPGSDAPRPSPDAEEIHALSLEGDAPFARLLTPDMSESKRAETVRRYIERNCAASQGAEGVLAPLAREEHAFSRALYDHAVQRGTRICTHADPAFVKNYNAKYNVVFVSKASGRSDQLFEAVHGLMHSHILHRENDARKAEPLQSRINRQLVSEAASTVAEFTVATEIRMRGTLFMNRTVAENPDYRIYSDNINRPDIARLSFNARLEAAAGRTIDAMIRRPEYLARYGEMTMTAYIRNTALNAAAPRAQAAMTLDQARGIGAVRPGLNLTAGVTPLAPADMAALSPGTFLMTEALAQARARHIGSRMPPLTVLPNRFAGVSFRNLSYQLEISRGHYTLDQAWRRAMLSGGYQYNKRGPVMDNLLAYGFQPDYSRAQTPERVRNLWTLLNVIRAKSPVIGTPLLSFADSKNVFICYASTSPMTNAIWSPNQGAILVSDRFRALRSPFGSIAHEMLHSIQQHNGIMTYDDAGIFKRQKMLLSAEAAARSVSLIMAQEMENNGDLSGWAHYENVHARAVFKDAYDAAIAQEQPVKAALEQAGLSTWRYILTQDQPWQNSYNNDILRDHINYIFRKNLRRPDDKFDLALARKSGYVSEAFNFTAGLQDFPEARLLFGENKQMHAAFDFVNLMHIEKTHGAGSRIYAAERRRLAAEKNPYLGVNLADVYDDLRAPGNTRGALEILNCRAGTGACAAPQAAQQQPAQEAKPEKKFPGPCV